jgi:hypothetical protein
MTHNTFAARNRLVKEAGMTPEHAETLLEVLQEQTETTAATKADIAELKTDLITKVLSALAVQTFAIVGLVVTLIKVIH